MMITDNCISDKIFKEVDRLWNTLVSYDIHLGESHCELKHPSMWYLEDSFVRAHNFSKYLNPPECDYTLNDENAVLMFEFYGHIDYLTEWDSESFDDDTLPRLDSYCYIPDLIDGCECTPISSCDKCLLYWFKKNLIYELYTLHYVHSSLLRDLDKDVFITEGDDHKCISGCGFYPRDYDRDPDNLKSLYCDLCVSKPNTSFANHIRNLIKEHEKEFSDIINFLTQPLPKVIDFGSDGKLVLQE